MHYFNSDDRFKASSPNFAELNFEINSYPKHERK